MVWDSTFLDLIGPQGKVEKVQSFPESEHRVHEAPVYLPETNELLFSDTDIVGWLWIVNIDTHEVCTVLGDQCIIADNFPIDPQTAHQPTIEQR